MFRHLLRVVVLAALTTLPASAQEPGSAAGWVDPRAIADWLPAIDPWRGRDVLPHAAFCRLRAVGDRDRRDTRWQRGQDGRRADDTLRGVVVIDHCVPYHDYLALYRPWLSPYSLQEVAELERARARLRRDAYPLGPHGEDARFGDPYSGRPDPYPEEHRLRRQLREEAGQSRPPQAAPQQAQESCARVSARLESRREIDVRLALPVLGATSAASLAAAIERELDAGRAINVAGIDGIALRLLPSDRVARLVVTPCAP